MGWAVLKITDGTTTIDLLNTNGGILLDDWSPAIQVPKAGGIWNGSPVTDGRRLAMRHYENAIEVFNVKISDVSQDKLITAIQNLFRLLDKAVYYWTTSWQEDPVWIEARATKQEDDGDIALQRSRRCMSSSREMTGSPARVVGDGGSLGSGG